ncbi:MAG: metal ABC transporter solute-binding protein, Zn/Mn family [Solirubrobacteraceae bacterium]
MRPTIPGLLACALLLAGCDGNGTTSPHSTLRVVAAESVWGSIAAQVGGARIDVRSLVADPGVDPHSYQSTPSDARTLAESQLAILSGIGYDAWASQGLAASPLSSRVVLNAGQVLGLSGGANQHQWYSPASVDRVIGALVAGLRRLDPAGGSYFAARARDFETRSLAPFDRLRSQIRARFRGVRVGASENVFAPLAADLGLDLITPADFMKAVGEGTDVSASDKQLADRQIARREIAVWVLNTQNETPDVARLSAAARARGIPVVDVSETLSPRGASFQDWQTSQLRSLLGALAEATHR